MYLMKPLHQNQINYFVHNTSFVVILYRMTIHPVIYGIALYFNFVSKFISGRLLLRFLRSGPVFVYV